ncbi:hypothetical protein TNCV_568471 [Trichonephila clavipes]|nr:hypothetical protein TNCV_568471 [Trichonephila clavipes]
MPLSRMENTTFVKPSIIDSHDMGLRNVYSPDAQKKTPIQRLFNAWRSEHLTTTFMPNLPVQTDAVVSRVFIASSALKQVVAIHPGRVGRPRQQPGQVNGGTLSISHVRWLGKSEQQARLTPSASG